jgi:polysaccharide pyruvyl transferase WcaK-like protein
MGIKIFVYGWYGKNNLGDDAFKDSFEFLWPDADFTFSSTIPQNVNLEYDLFWVGGGSFLEQHIQGIEDVKLPIAFVGVGGCSCPAEATREALEKAKIIVFRDAGALKHWSTPQTYAISDLVFARDFEPLKLPKKDQIAIFLNDFITPKGKACAEWKTLAYSWFLQEFSKILDRFSSKYTIKLFPMCVNPRVDDRRTAAAILGRSEYPQRYDWEMGIPSEMDLRKVISESKFVITQRFHGLVYSILEDTPCVTMTMHDKFAALCSELDIPILDFYGMTDKKFTEVLNQVRYRKFVTPKIIEYMKEKRLGWQEIAVTVAKEFNM